MSAELFWRGCSYPLRHRAYQKRYKPELVWHDFNTGVVYPLTLTSISVFGSSYPVSDFYDGATASGDVIDERPTFGSTISTLRDFNTNSWNLAQVSINGGALMPIRSVPHAGLIMQDGGTTYSTPTAPSNPEQFTDNWETCGHLG